MTKQITTAEVLSEAYGLIGAPASGSYVDMSESDMKDFVFDHVDSMLNPKMSAQLEKFVDLVTDNAECLDTPDTASLSDEQLKQLGIMDVIRKTLLPLSVHYSRYLQTDLGDCWGEPFMDNAKAVDFVRKSRWSFINFHIVYKIASFVTIGFYDKGNPILAEYVMSRSFFLKHELEKRADSDIAESLQSEIIARKSSSLMI